MTGDALKDILIAASADLAADPNGGLRFSFREQIWTAFGPPVDDTTVQNLGLIRRTRLAVICVKRVIPLWEAAWPSDDLPHRLLQGAEDYCRQKIGKKEASKLKDSGWLHADNLSAELYDAGDAAGQIAAFVCYAACQAMRVAVFDEPFGPDYASATTYGEGDPYSLDAAYEVSYVAAGGWPPRGEGNAAKRRSYWEWYLTEAVPTSRDASL